MESLQTLFVSLGQAQTRLALENAEAKNAALAAANARDVEKARSGGMKESLVDRLMLNDARIDGIFTDGGVFGP
jgi:glutamate-5-semialdehyde dehydrogenase